MQLADATPEPTKVDDATRLDYVAIATSPDAAGKFKLATQLGPSAVIGVNPSSMVRADRERAARLLDKAHELGARTIVPGDEEWPHRIGDLNRDGGTGGAPLCLWALGPARLNSVLERAVLITGSRSSTEYGNHVAQQIGFQLADGRRGWSVANGGGYGIDSEALKGAMVANCHTPTLVMLPCGLDRRFPLQHADMFQAVAATGLLLSACPPGADLTKKAIRHRCDMLAAMTAATVIVEASQRSDCLPTASRAAGMGRPVLAVPGPVTSVHSTGCHQLIRDGVARLVTDAADILAELTKATPA